MLDVLRGAGVSATWRPWSPAGSAGRCSAPGGLVRAYGDAVRAAAGRAGTLRRSLLTELALDLDHAEAGRVEGELRARGVARPRDVAYDARVRLLLAAPADEVARVEAAVAAATAGRSEPVATGERWVDLPS